MPTLSIYKHVRSNLFRFHGLLTVLTVLILHVYDFAFTRQVATIIDHDHVHNFLHPVMLDLFDLFDLFDFGSNFQNLYINKGLRGFRAIQARNALNRQSTRSFPLLWLLQRNGSQLRVFGRWIPSRPKRDLQLLLVSFVGSMREKILVLSPVLWGQKQSTSITYTSGRDTTPTNLPKQSREILMLKGREEDHLAPPVFCRVTVFSGMPSTSQTTRRSSAPLICSSDRVSGGMEIWSLKTRPSLRQLHKSSGCTW